ncbi:hypothetical protein BDV11DRAFT_168047 [Aspergillus similis]
MNWRRHPVVGDLGMEAPPEESRRFGHQGHTFSLDKRRNGEIHSKMTCAEAEDADLEEDAKVFG